MRSRTIVSIVVPLLVFALLVAACFAAVLPALAASSSFPDVPSSHPYSAAITGMAGQGIIAGYGNGDFGPDDPVTRQQFAKMIVLTLGLSVVEGAFPDSTVPFVDLGPDDPADLYPHEYVAACARNNITKGIDATHFSPLAKISRQQVITMVLRAADGLHAGILQTVPAEWSGVLGYNDPAHGTNLRKAEFNGLLNGIRASASSSGLAGWNPTASATRGEVAQILWNLLEKMGGGTTTSSMTTTSSSTSTTSTTVPASASGDLLHFWWQGDVLTNPAQVESVTDIAGGPQITGPVFRESWMTGFSTVVATGVDGHLLLYTVAEDQHTWSLTDVSAETGRMVMPGSVIEVFTDVPASGPTILHIATLGPSGDLLHFSAAAGGSWSSANVSTLTGFKVAYTDGYGDQDAHVLHVFGCTPSGDLLHFQHPAGGGWEALNVSATTGRKTQGPPIFMGRRTRSSGDSLSVGVEAAATASSEHRLLLFHRSPGGWWTAEDVYLPTHLTYGGYVDFADNETPFAGGILMLDAYKHLWLLERLTPYYPSPFRITDISNRIADKFAMVVPEHLVFTLPEFPVVPSTETHLSGITPTSHLIEFWIDGAGRWYKEDLSETTSQPISQQLTWIAVQDGTQYWRNILGVSPDGHLVFIWGDPKTRDWEAVDVSAATSRQVLGGWRTSSWLAGVKTTSNVHLVIIGR